MWGTDDTRIAQRVSVNERTRYNVRRNEASTSQEKSHKRNIHAVDLVHLTNKPTPKRLMKRQATIEKITTECHGLRRFDIVNEKMYLGLNVFNEQGIGRTELMAQKPHTFIRDTVTIIWGEEGILNRCFRLDKVSVTFAGRSPWKQFESDKLQLLRDLLEHYLDHHRFSQKEKVRHKQEINTTLARFVQDIRKPYKHFVRKQLLYQE